MILLYGIVSYVVGITTFLYAIGFVGNVVVPKSIDSGREGDFTASLIIDLSLLGLFATQHSVMARQGFKKIWIRLVPHAIERSTYVLLSSLLLALLFWQWRPLLTVVWDERNAFGVLTLQVLFLVGWAIVFISIVSINQSDMLGLRQVSLREKYTDLGFRMPFLYKFVRHPIMLGFIIAFWATPFMTLGHLLFAAVSTAYILIAIRFEERDLSNFYGAAYDDYRRRVPMLIPRSEKK